MTWRAATALLLLAGGIVGAQMLNLSVLIPFIIVLAPIAWAVIPRRIENIVSRQIPKPSEHAVVVSYVVERLKWRTGSDVGWIWSEGGLLHFQGLDSDWAIPLEGESVLGEHFRIRSTRPLLRLTLPDELDVIVHSVSLSSDRTVLEDLFFMLRKQRVCESSQAKLPPRSVKLSEQRKLERFVTRIDNSQATTLLKIAIDLVLVVVIVSQVMKYVMEGDRLMMNIILSCLAVIGVEMTFAWANRFWHPHPRQVLNELAASIDQVPIGQEDLADQKVEAKAN